MKQIIKTIPAAKFDKIKFNLVNKPKPELIINPGFNTMSIYNIVENKNTILLKSVR